MKTYHFDKVHYFAGFAVENGKNGETVKILTRASLTSDETDFYKYIEQISAEFLTKADIHIDSVHHMLVVIHNDQSADVYINEFTMSVEARIKKAAVKGAKVMLSDIADIRNLRFPDTDIQDSDKVIFCCKVGWRFGLFFDLTPGMQQVDKKGTMKLEKLDIQQMHSMIGRLYRYLAFYDVYKTLESKDDFNAMLKDGWFPFIEIIGKEYKALSETYVSQDDIEDKVQKIVDGFNKKRVNAITRKWWGYTTFKDKKKLIQAGVKAFLDNDSAGFINCIKNLTTEIEGVLRAVYLEETGKGKKVKSTDLIDYIIKKETDKSGGDSLLLPTAFLGYLKGVVFADFDTEAKKVNMSRNSSGHGVAAADQYTKSRALQLILVLDQLYFYSKP